MVHQNTTLTPTDFTMHGAAAPFRMVPIPGGTFRMGATKDPADPNYDPEAGRNETPHPVPLDAFLLGETPVTQAQWTALMGKNPSRFKENGENCPVERVSWFDAVVFCNRLSVEMNRKPCYRDAKERVLTNLPSLQDLEGLERWKSSTCAPANFGFGFPDRP